MSDAAPLTDAVRVAWRIVLPWHDAGDDEGWADAGGDSLDAMKLLAHLELMLGRPLSPELIDLDVTPPELARRIAAIGG